MHGTKDCLKLWILLDKDISRITNELISLDFDTGDHGNKNLLSMEQRDSKNLIPDLYAYCSFWNGQNISKKGFRI